MLHWQNTQGLGEGAGTGHRPAPWAQGLRLRAAEGLGDSSAPCPGRAPADTTRGRTGGGGGPPEPGAVVWRKAVRPGGLRWLCSLLLVASFCTVSVPRLGSALSAWDWARGRMRWSTALSGRCWELPGGGASVAGTARWPRVGEGPKKKGLAGGWVPTQVAPPSFSAGRWRPGAEAGDGGVRGEGLGTGPAPSRARPQPRLASLHCRACLDKPPHKADPHGWRGLQASAEGPRGSLPARARSPRGGAGEDGNDRDPDLNSQGPGPRGWGGGGGRL